MGGAGKIQSYNPKWGFMDYEKLDVREGFG